MKKRVRPYKILAINQATSLLFRSILDALAASGADVHLLTGSFENEKGYVPAFSVRLACVLKKAPAWRRIWTWSLFTLEAVFELVKYRECLIIVVTNPPLTPWITPLIKRLFGIHYVELIYDVYPDIMERMGMIRPGGIFSKCLRYLSTQSHLMADHIITLSDDMKSTILRQISEKEHTPQVTVIPNWADTNLLRPLSKDENPFAKEHDLVDKFVIMYSGAFGASHDIPNLLETAKLLEDLPNIRFVLIGGGTKEHDVLKLVLKMSLSNLLVLPWQPIDNIKYSLSCADCHIVSQDESMAGVSVPSKIFTSLAVGSVIIAVAPPETQLQEIIEKYHCGILVPPKDSGKLAHVLRILYQNPALCKEMSSNSRLAAEAEFNTEICTRKYVNIIKSL